MLLPAGPACAQSDSRTIVVTGARPPAFDTAPERTLSADDVSAYGLATIGEILDEVTAETGEDRDEPVYVVNGRRVSGLSDIEDLPAEAIEAIEILPPGSATRVGASSTRRIYSIALKKKLDSVAARAAVRLATAGGWTGGRGDVTLTRLRDARRINLTARVRREGRLLESERRVVQPAGAPAGAGRLRSLRPALSGHDFGFSAADQLSPTIDAALSGKLATSRQSALLGPVAAPAGTLRAREQTSRNLNGNLDLTVNAALGDWLVTALGSYLYQRRTTATERISGPELARTRAVTQDWNVQLVAGGPLFRLPAGDLRLNLGGGLARDVITASRSFAGTRDFDRFAQSSRSLSASLEVPIASREQGFLGFAGELTANAELSRTHASRFGWFTNRTFSLRWKPAPRLVLSGSVSRGRSPPAVALVADPVLETPGVRYFDPLRGETVDVVEISGGSAGVPAQTGITRRLSASLKPAIAGLSLRLTGDYRAIRNRNLVSALPPAGGAILTAFPDRFIRDAAGVLTTVDVRPVTFASQNQDLLRLGLNLSLPLGGGRSGTGAAGRPRPRIELNANFTRLLKSELVIRPGQVPIDLLSRDAVAFGGLARPRNQLDFTLGYAERGLGLRLGGQLRGKGFLSVSTPTASEVLRFRPVTTLNLRAFAEARRILPDAAWARGSRIALSVSNLTDSRQRVLDRAGRTPLAYQPAYRDPLGRSVEIELRKVF